jgi:monoterpene epsilon-lactone hydrolase
MSWQNYALKRYLQQNMKGRMTTAPSIDALRQFLVRASEKFMPLAQSIRIYPAVIDKFSAEWIEPDGKPAITILYMHGGSFFLASAEIYRNIPSTLANALPARALSLDYPLAPEAPCPAAIDSARAAYDYLLSEGVSPENLVLVGNEAGACLLFNLLKRLKHDGAAMPAAMVALSPLTDLTLASDSITANARSDTFLSPQLVKSGVTHFLDGTQVEAQAISPVSFDLEGFPPTFIQASEEEILADDTKRMAKALEGAGVHTELDMWRETPHTWQLAVSDGDKGLPEANDAMVNVARFIKKVLNS